MTYKVIKEIYKYYECSEYKIISSAVNQNSISTISIRYLSFFPFLHQSSIYRDEN